MNDNNTITLPELSQESIARIENAVFDEIDDERQHHTPSTAATARPRRRWITALGVAAAFAGGILVAPPLLSAVTSPSGGAADYAVSEAAPARDSAVAGDGTATQFQADAAMAVRDIITSAEVTLRVADVEDAATKIATIAGQHDGYTERLNVGGSRPSTDEARERVESGSITIRVPADKLDAAMSALDSDGEVLRSSISRDDVTSTAIDLRARVTSLQASVERLTELMTKSGSVADLIAAETALSERQAELESYQQQLKTLDQRVAMSSIDIQLTSKEAASSANPAGFNDGLLAGWNGLIVSLNAVVVALGFLLPWLVIAGAVVLVVWLVRRRRSRNA